MTDNEIVFKGDNLKITKEQYDTFVASISTQNPTKEEIKLHLWYCDSKNVNPLDKLIYFTKRKGRYTPITSIDFMRLRAESSNAYAGSDDANFLYSGVDKENKDRNIHSAQVVVYKIVQGVRCPFSATARWSEYAPFNLSEASAFMWKKMPHTMLAKCAEALALRKAFPGQLHGLYASEEMAQDGRYINDVVIDVEAGNENSPKKDEEVPPTRDAKPVDEAFPQGEMAKAAEELADGVKLTKKELLKDGENIKSIAATTGQTPKQVVLHINKLEGEEFSIKEVIESIKSLGE